MYDLSCCGVCAWAVRFTLSLGSKMEKCVSEGQGGSITSSLLHDTDFRLTQHRCFELSAVLPTGCLILQDERRSKHWYLSAVFNPLQYYGKVWPVFRLVLPALGHYTISTTAAGERIMKSRKEKGRLVNDLQLTTVQRPQYPRVYCHFSQSIKKIHPAVGASVGPILLSNCM